MHFQEHIWCSKQDMYPCHVSLISLVYLSDTDTNKQVNGHKQGDTWNLEPSAASLDLAGLSLRFKFGHLVAPCWFIN